MRNNKGLTLVEIIVAIALIGIIAAGMVPAFASMLKLTVDTKNITINAFDAQGEAENRIFDLRALLANDQSTDGIEGVSTEYYQIFGNTKSITLYKYRQVFPSNNNKELLVFLSEKLAKMEKKQLLEAGGVSIEVSDDSLVNKVANMSHNPKPTLIGKYNINTDPNWYANIYKWYVSEIGNPDPKFPDDYEIIIIPGIAPSELGGISSFVNRYILFSVTPVDIHGVRGNEVVSDNRVYILGEEWRAGLFAWIDKDDDKSYIANYDVGLTKDKLTEIFDSSKKFLDLDEVVWLDPSEGQLYVPMSMDRISGETVGSLTVDGDKRLDWYTDKSINLATDIVVENNTDIKIVTRDESIILYQYLSLDNNGRAVFNSEGFPILIQDGPNLKTLNANITFKTEGKGNIIIQKYSTLDSQNVELIAHGPFRMYSSNIFANNNISIDTSQGNTYPGNRNIYIDASKIDGRIISLNSRNATELNATSITGDGSEDSSVTFNSVDGIKLSEAEFSNIDVSINDNASMVGGGWTNGKMNIADGNALLFQRGINKVDNSDSLHLGNTGKVSFTNSMAYDLKNPLTITLDRIDNNDVSISTNYGRNVGYADSNSFESIALRSYLNLGSGQTNMKYKIMQTSGDGNPTIYCAFDGDNTMKIDARGTEELAYSNGYKLVIEDKYASGVLSAIVFTVSAEANGSPVVDVIGPVIQTSIVTFNSNGGSAEGYPLTKEVINGQTISTLPEPPTKDGGWAFLSWNMQSDGKGDLLDADTTIWNDITAYAQYTFTGCTVTFDKNTGDTNASPNTISLQKGSIIGNLPTPPTKVGFIFQDWNMKADGSGTSVDENTKVDTDITVYARYVLAVSVTFDKNNGDTEADPRSIVVAQGTKISTLPTTPPTKTDYIFRSWNTKNGSSGNWGTEVNENTIVNANITVYARYGTAVQITFDKNGGDTEANPTTVMVSRNNRVSILPTPPTKSEYRFKGWNTEADGGGTWVDENYVVLNRASFTVYAQWIPDNFNGISIGDYVKVGDVLFQKISDNKLLSYDNVKANGNNDMNWNTAMTVAGNYYNGFSSFSYVSNQIGGSGLIGGDLLSSLSTYEQGQQYIANALRNTNYSWWVIGSQNQHYRVRSTNGTVGSGSNSQYSCRPYITIYATGLNVSLGTGTANDPYVLIKQ